MNLFLEKAHFVITKQSHKTLRQFGLDDAKRKYSFNAAQNFFPSINYSLAR